MSEAYTLSRVASLLEALVILTVILLAVVLWPRFQNLRPGKRFVLVLLALVVLGAWTGHITADRLERAGAPVTWEGAVAQAQHIWLRFDGFTRTHQWVGVLMLALTPGLLWPWGGER